MLKFDGGNVVNLETDVTKDIIVEVKPSKNNLKGLLIGSGITLAGIACMIVTAFKNGAEAYLNAENKALGDAGLLNPPLEEHEYEYEYIKLLKRKKSSK